MEEVVTYLTRQHREVEDLLKQALDCTDAARRRHLFAEAADHLTVHIESEEHILFPAVKAANTTDILLESLEEHLSLKRLLVDLMALDPDATTFEPKLKVLKEQTEHHHEEEEEDLFPKLERALAQAERERLAAEMDVMQQRLARQDAPRKVVANETAAAATLPGGDVLER